MLSPQNWPFKDGGHHYILYILKSYFYLNKVETLVFFGFHVWGIQLWNPKTLFKYIKYILNNNFLISSVRKLLKTHMCHYSWICLQPSLSVNLYYVPNTYVHKCVYYIIFKWLLLRFNQICTLLQDKNSKKDSWKRSHLYFSFYYIIGVDYFFPNVFLN